MRSTIVVAILALCTACQQKGPSRPDFGMDLEHYDQGKRFMSIEGEVVMVDEGAYHVDVGSHIQDRWTELMHAQTRDIRVPKPEYKMLASVTVDNGGNVQDVHITESSGSDKLDDLLLQAIRESSPVPAPPPELVDEGAQFTFDLRWEIVNKNPVQ